MAKRVLEDSASDKACPLCDLGRDIAEPSERFAVWLHARGWLIDVCGGEPTFAHRLKGATWFSTEDEARAALYDIARGTGADDQDVGAVVTL